MRNDGHDDGRDEARGQRADTVAGVLRRDEAGATAIEYSLIVGLISFAILTTLASIGRVISTDVFDVIASAASSV